MERGLLTHDQAMLALADANRTGFGLLASAKARGFLSAEDARAIKRELLGVSSSDIQTAPAPPPPPISPQERARGEDARPTRFYDELRARALAEQQRPTAPLQRGRLAGQEFDPELPTRSLPRGPLLTESLQGATTRAEPNRPFQPFDPTSSSDRSPPPPPPDATSGVSGLVASIEALEQSALIRAPESSAAHQSFQRSSDGSLVPLTGVGPATLPDAQTFDDRRTLDEQRSSDDSEARASGAQQLFAAARYRFLAEPVGETAAVVDQRLDRRMAMVIGGTDDPEAFYREARICSQLDHSSIPKIHDIGVFMQSPYYTQDSIEGRSLRERVDKTGMRFNIPGLLRIFLEVAAAVEHAHSRGICHGDLDPEHIRCGRFGEVWLQRWERATALDGASALTRSILATPAPSRSQAPEQERPRAPEIEGGKDASRATDIWELGRLLYWLLLGSAPPRRGRLNAQGALQVRGARLDKGLAAIIGKALAPAPRNRYRTVADLREDLEAFLDGRGLDAYRESLGASLRRLARRQPVIAGMVGVFALLLTILAARTAIRISRAVTETQDSRRLATRLSEEAAELRVAIDTGAAQAEAIERRLALREAFESGLSSALRGSARGGPDDAALAAFTEAERAAGALDELAPEGPRRYEARARLWAARADWALRRARDPDPAAAMRDYARLERRGADRAEALFGRFIAARRLPGRSKEIAGALEDLIRLKDEAPVYAALARIERDLRRAEALFERAREIQSRDRLPPDANPANQEGIRLAEALLAAKTFEDLESRGGYPKAYFHELRGRCRIAASGIGHHSQCKGRYGGPWNEGMDDCFRAALLDASEPTAAVLLMATQNEKLALHQTWRWINGWAYSRIFRALRFYQRPEPLIEVGELLQRLRHNAGPAALCEPLSRALDNAPELAPGIAARARMVEARARFARGEDFVIKGELGAVPLRFRAEWLALKAHELLLGDDPPAGLAALDAATEALASAESPQAFYDLYDLFTDPRCRRPELLRRLSRLIQGLEGHPQLALFVGARIFLGARLNFDVEPDFAAFQAAGLPLSEEAARAATLGFARQLIERQPARPGLHETLLELWVNVNPHNHSERYCYEAQELLVAQLRALGQERAAAAFSGALEPVDEVWVRRVWVPRELHGWGRRSP